MIVLLGGAAVLLALFSIPEVLGALSPTLEDTFSEWVWDLPLGFVLLISTIFVVVGVLAIWAAGHFLEGWRGRDEDE